MRSRLAPCDGYAMAVLLVGIAIMGIMLSVAMPVWHHAMRREREEELIFRGNQYARAVGLYQRKNGNAYPPSIDVLVRQKYLRKKYKDPMVEDGEFQLVPAGAMQAGQVGATPQSSGTGRAQQFLSQVESARRPSSSGTMQSAFGRQGASGTQSAFGGGALGTGTFGRGTVVTAIAGVMSKSTEQSIRLYNGRNHYNEWIFVYTGPTGRGGGLGAAGRVGRGQGRGGQGMGPGGPGGRGGRGRGGFGPGQFDPTQFPPTQFPPGGRGRGPGGM